MPGAGQDCGRGGRSGCGPCQKFTALDLRHWSTSHKSFMSGFEKQIKSIILE
jgi:hypothetical protein